MNEMISSDLMMILTLLRKREADKMVQNCIGTLFLIQVNNSDRTKFGIKIIQLY